MHRHSGIGTGNTEYTGLMPSTRNAPFIRIELVVISVLSVLSVLISLT